MLIKRSAPSGLVVSVADAKLRLRVDGDDDDDDIEMMIRTATATAERHTGRVLLPTEFEHRFSGWRSCYRLPVSPVRNITAVKYLDAQNVEAAVPDTDWYFLADDRGATVTFVETFAGPALSTRDGPVRVIFEAGYDDPKDLGEVPLLQPDPRDVHMVLLLVGSWYAHRAAVSDKPLTAIPDGWRDLAEQRRIYR